MESANEKETGHLNPKRRLQYSGNNARYAI